MTLTFINFKDIYGTWFDAYHIAVQLFASRYGKLCILYNLKYLHGSAVQCSAVQCSAEQCRAEKPVQCSALRGKER